MNWSNVSLVTLVMILSCRSEENGGDYSKDALIAVIPNNAADREYLIHLLRKNIIDMWSEDRMIIGNKKLMRVNQCRLREVKKNFRKRKMKVRVVSPNLQRLIRRKYHPLRMKQSVDSDPSNFNFGQYHTLKDIEAFLKDFVEKHKDMSKLENFGKSYERRSLYAIKLNNKESDKKIILIQCGLHAREWVSISFCLYFINTLITGYKENKKDLKSILDKYNFIVIPVINPDGYVHSQEKDRLWRKTRSKNPDSSCLGVDGNRNLYDPGEITEKHDPCEQDYPGQKPFSESEIAAFKDLVEKTKGQLKAYFDIHTFGQYWLLPWAKYKNKKPQHYAEMMKVAQVGVKALAGRYKTKFKPGMASEILYQRKGIGMDYLYEKGYVNYSYALELRGKDDCTTGSMCGFLLPESEIIPTCKETTDGVIAAVLAMK